MKDEETIVSCSSLEERWAADSQRRSTHQLSDTCFPCLRGSRLHKSQRKQSAGLLDIHNNNIRRSASSLSLHKCSHMIAAQGDSKTLRCLKTWNKLLMKAPFLHQNTLNDRSGASAIRIALVSVLSLLLKIQLDEAFINSSATDDFCQTFTFQKIPPFPDTVTFQTCKDFPGNGFLLTLTETTLWS